MSNYGEDDYGEDAGISSRSSLSQPQISYCSSNGNEEAGSLPSQQSEGGSENSESETAADPFEIIDEEKYTPAKNRVTLPTLTKFEKARVLGVRAGQISKGSPIYVNLSKNDFDTLNPLDIAEVQLKENVIPFVIRRIHPNDQYEDWLLHELKVLE